MRVLIFLLPLFLFSCAKENQGDCFKSYGDEITETRMIPEFNAIYTGDKIDIVYRQSTAFYVEVSFGENIIHHIKTEVVDGVLNLSNNARCNWVRDLSKKPEVVVYAPGFSLLENRGTGNIEFADALEWDKFVYDQWDSNGNVLLRLDVADAEIQMHTGSSRVEVRGIAGKALLYSACFGKLFASEFITPFAGVNNSSFQPMEVYSNGYLYGAIYARGDIRYAGNPTEIVSVIEGSGRLLPL